MSTPGGRGRPPRLGLVLGAGGEAGVAYHRGVLRAMGDLGLRPASAEVVVGTSAGSLVGAGLRAGDISGVARRAFDGVPEEPRPSRTGRAALLDLARRPRGAVSALLLRPDVRLGRIDLGRIVKRYDSAFGDAWPAADLWIATVRRSDARRVVFGRRGAPRARVSEAVAASCAVPGFAAPIRIGGTEYVDGGVHSPTNADLLAGRELDLIVVSSPMSVDSVAGGARPDTPMRWWCRRLLRNELWTLRGAGKVLLVEPGRDVLAAMGPTMLSSDRADAIQDAAYEHTRRILRRSASDAGAAHASD